MQLDAAEVRMFLYRLEQYATTLDATLRQHRLKSSTGQDLIDVLIRRLQADLAAAA